MPCAYPAPVRAAAAFPARSYWHSLSETASERVPRGAPGVKRGGPPRAGAALLRSRVTATSRLAGSLLLFAFGSGLGHLGDVLHHRRVGQRGGITERTFLHHVAQKPAHDLAAARLRQIRRERDVLRPREGSDLRSDVLAQLVGHFGGSDAAALERDEC